LTAAWVAVLAILISPRAYCWDSGTHRLITRLAIGALPPSPVARFMARNTDSLEYYSTVPDTKLKKLYGEAEKRRHYINLEYFGPHPIDALVPDIHQMQRRFPRRLLMRAGTLPWTIEEVSTQLQAAWESGDCHRVLVLSGYLSHYVGDLSQPLHTTKFFDGEMPSDRGMHARLELAVDQSTRHIARLARPSVHASAMDSVWNETIDGLRRSNARMAEIEQADRGAQGSSRGDEGRYRAILIRDQGAMIASQIADSASRLGSIWIYEWNQAGHPAACTGRR